MPSKKIIKRRIASVTTTKKIVTAMNLVASSKLQKTRSRMEAARPFYQGIAEAMRVSAAGEAAQEHIFFMPRQVKNTAYLIITSDRGLCGGYNTNLTAKALAHMNAGGNEKIIVVGQKGYEFFARQGKNILHNYYDVLETDFHEDTAHIGRRLTELYISGEVDAVYVAYTQFESVSTHVPSIKRLLPVDLDGSAPDRPQEMKYDPDMSVYLDYAVPLYVNALIYNMLLESSACEQAARMFNMEAAENNASDILTKLTRIYNRNRQKLITEEINEIVSGADISK